ncbi:hypothetical protein NQ318_000715 [Aromia moschata]|uniref:Peptidase A2 domain-containing protein n=1 Tax=Aromia moschata TaxID=1265417 RepID=A0AAV8XUU5_9CUCU|nr:hypothetical protein NQ318_000715 [Aromia moschata]
MVNTRSTKYDEETTAMDVSEILKFLQQGRQEDREEAERREEKKRRQEDEQRRRKDREEAERRRQEDREEAERARGKATAGRMNSDDRRTNGGDRRTVRRQKGERNSDGKRTNGGDRRTNDDDKRTETRRRGAKKSIELRRSFRRIGKKSKRRLERRLEDTKRQVQKEILEKIEELEHQLHRTSIADSGDCSTSPATPLQHSSLMHTERSVHKMLKPPTYDGQSSWSMYRRQFEAAAKANGWTPQEMATSLVISLRGQALEILQSIPEEQQNDYDRIVGALEIRYGHKYLRQVYQSQIKSRQQRSNESLQEYEADIERLIHLAYPQAPKEFLEQIGIQTFIDGLVDTEMQQALRLGRHTTISDALVAALEFKAAKEASRSYKSRITSKKFGKRQLVDARGRVSTTYTQCPKISVSKISSDERSLLVHGYLDDKWRSFVIDTGATRTILRPDILPKPPKELSRHVRLETATGELIPVHGEVYVKIQLGSKIMYHQVLIADIRDDCILGLDILSKHGFVVDIKNRIIQKQNEEIVMAPKLKDYNQSRRIIVEEDIQMPQGSENIIIAKLDGNGEDEWSSEELKKSQKKDSDLKLIRNWLKNGVRPTWQEVSRYGTTIKGYWAQWNSLCLRDGLLHRKWESPDGVSAVYQLVLPKARIHQVLEELHNSPTGGHFGVTRTFGSSKGPILLDKLSPRRRRMVQEMDWDKLVPLFLLSYRSSQHESTTYTPSMLTSGREMKLPTDLILGHPVEENQERSLPEFVEDLRERMDRIHQFAREKLKIHSDKMKQRPDTTSTKTAFKPGDAVWLYAQKETKGKSPKLQSNWEGPYTIIKKINDLVYRIQLSPRSKPKVVHLERLAKYTGHNPPIHKSIGLSSKIHSLELKTVLFGTNNFEEGAV